MVRPQLRRNDARSLDAGEYLTGRQAELWHFLEGLSTGDQELSVHPELRRPKHAAVALTAREPMRLRAEELGTNLAAELRALRARAAELDTLAKGWQDRAARAEQVATRAEQRHLAVTNSKSWRITAPLRAVGNAARRARPARSRSLPASRRDRESGHGLGDRPAREGGRTCAVVRILIVAPIVPFADAPATMSGTLDSQLEALRHRHEITLVTGLGDEPWEEQAAWAALESGIDVHVADRRISPDRRQRIRRRLRLASTWARTRQPRSTQWFGAPSVQAVLDRLAVTRRFDVVAVEDTAMAALRLPPRVPIVLTDHEVSRARPARWRPGGTLALAEWAFRELDCRWEDFQAATWRTPKLVQVFTYHDARAISARAPDVSPRVRVNPFGMIMPKRVDPARSEPDTVLFTGNFSHPPNRDAAVWLAREIMPRVRARRPGARLLIVGSIPPRDVIELQKHKAEVTPDVRDVQRFLEAACACAAPMRLGGAMRLKMCSTRWPAVKPS